MKRGYKMSIGSRIKMSQAMKGNTNGSGNIGKKHSFLTRQKMSSSMRGEKNPKWKGGITNIHYAMRNSIEYKEWRKSVYERDIYTCQMCGDSSGGNLEAHHKQELSKRHDLCYTLDNGITLCKVCHRDLHKNNV